MAFWVLGAKTGFPGDNFFGQINTWPTGVLAPINKGLSTWTAYRYAGDPEVFRYNQYAERVWSGAFFGGSGIPGDKGNNIRNVMMFDEQNLSEDGVFPFTPPTYFSNDYGPVAEIGRAHV